jgi:hypothetical protein
VPNIFNAITTGVGGISTSADSSGTFAFASNGSTVATISGTGVINASAITGLTTALTVAQGGTGATSLAANNVLLGNGTSAVQVVAPSTSGNVLTSNGTAWVSQALPAGGVTSLNGQTGAITNTSLYAIGSYVTGRAANTTAYAVDATLAGSSLRATPTGTRWVGALNHFCPPNESGNISGICPTVSVGTWRCVSPSNGQNTDNMWSGLWVRIS